MRMSTTASLDAPLAGARSLPLHYAASRRKTPEEPAITIELGGPAAAKSPSADWQRVGEDWGGAATPERRSRARLVNAPTRPGTPQDRRAAAHRRSSRRRWWDGRTRDTRPAGTGAPR